MTCNPRVTGTGKPLSGSDSSSVSSPDERPSEGANTGGAQNQGGGGGQNSNTGASGGQGGQDGAGTGQGTGSGDRTLTGDRITQDTKRSGVKFNKSRVNEVTSELKARGYSDVQIAAVLGHWQNESGFNTSIKGDSGTSVGMAQWRNERWKGPNGLLAHAEKNGLDPYSVKGQVSFFDWELNNTEKSAGYKLKNATTLSEASWAMSGFERFKGYKDPNFSQNVGRLRNTNTFYDYLQEGGATS